VLLCAITVVSARPLFTSADRFDADASLGQTQPFDFCNEFSIYDTRAHNPRALPSPDAGGYPATVATHDALFTLLSPSSFVMQRWLELDAPQRATRNPRHPDSRSGPRRPVEPSPPPATPFKWASRTWETRRPKERSEGEPDFSREKNGPWRSLRFEVPPRLLFRTPPVTGDACETGWRPVRVLVPACITRRGFRSDRSPVKDYAILKAEGLCPVGIE